MLSCKILSLILCNFIMMSLWIWFCSSVSVKFCCEINHPRTLRLKTRVIYLAHSCVDWQFELGPAGWFFPSPHGLGSTGAPRASDQVGNSASLRWLGQWRWLGYLTLLSKRLCKCKWKLLSWVQLCVTPWAAARQSPLSMEFSRKEYQSGEHSLLQGIFLTQGLNMGLLYCRQILYHVGHQDSPDLCI